MKLKKIFNSVYETNEYNKLNYEYAEQFFKERYDGWKFHGGCTAVTKTLSNGDTITGRNMDLTISNKVAYVVRTRCEGNYSTIGLSYINMFGPNETEIEQNGLPRDYSDLLPFLCTDIMNSEGLYIETNMRTGEFDCNGTPVFGCSGTNPGAPYRVCSMILPRYLAEHCANVEDVIEDEWTTDFVFDSKNKEIVQARINKNIEIVQNSTEQELKDMNKYWESVSTVVANCNKKEIFVRFFEKDNYKYTIRFN